MWLVGEARIETREECSPGAAHLMNERRLQIVHDAVDRYGNERIVD